MSLPWTPHSGSRPELPRLPGLGPPPEKPPAPPLPPPPGTPQPAPLWCPMAPPKHQGPTVAFVPGSWLPGHAYSHFTSMLEARGFPVKLVNLWSFRGDGFTVEKDAQRIKIALEELMSDKKEVVIIAHGYGAMPASAAARGLKLAWRPPKDGSPPGRILGMIFISGLLVRAHLRHWKDPNARPDWAEVTEPPATTCKVKDPGRILMLHESFPFWGHIMTYLQPHSLEAFESPQPTPAHCDPDLEGRLAYQVTTANQAWPMQEQNVMLQDSGARWLKHTIYGSYMSPFGSRINESITAVDAAVAQFVQCASSHSKN